MYKSIKKHFKSIRSEFRKLKAKDRNEKMLALFDDTRTSKLNYYFDLFLIFLILLSCALYVVLTYLDPLSLAYKVTLGFEIFLMILFTIEYALRLKVEKSVSDYATSWYGIVDLLTILPFWLSLFTPVIGMQFFRILRVFKLYRFFKKYFDETKIKKEVASKILITKMVFTLGALLFISSGLIYTFESPVNEAINTFDDALYFSLVTITTVGFGDITPITKAGRLVVMIIVLSSIFLIPVYLASLLRTFMSNSDKQSVTCKNCGLKYHDKNAVHCKMCGELIYQEYDGR